MVDAMIPGAEQAVSYLWQAWIRSGRRREAAWQGNARLLRQTGRYRWSLAIVAALLSALVIWLAGLVREFPNEPAVLVFLVAAGFLWALATAGTVSALRERVVFDQTTITRRSLLGGQAIRWDGIAWFEFPANGDVVIADYVGNRLRVSANLDGLGTLLDELGSHTAVPGPVLSRLA